MDTSYKFISEVESYIEVDTKGDKQYYISGYISTPDRDLVNDVITDKCLDDMIQQLSEKNIKLDVEHELWDEDAQTKTPVGRIIEVRRDKKGVWVNCLLNKNYPKFKEILEQVKQKFIDAFSIAFKPIDFVMQEIDGIKTRLLNKVLLLNVAITGNPANPECLMDAVVSKSIQDYVETLDKPEREVSKMADEIKYATAEEFSKLKEEIKTLSEKFEAKEAEEKSILDGIEEIKSYFMDDGEEEEADEVEDEVEDGEVEDEVESEGGVDETEAEEVVEAEAETKSKIDYIYEKLKEPQYHGVLDVAGDDVKALNEKVKAESKTVSPIDTISM